MAYITEKEHWSQKFSGSRFGFPWYGRSARLLPPFARRSTTWRTAASGTASSEAPGSNRRRLSRFEPRHNMNDLGERPPRETCTRKGLAVCWSLNVLVLVPSIIMRVDGGRERRHKCKHPYPRYRMVLALRTAVLLSHLLSLQQPCSHFAFL